MAAKQAMKRAIWRFIAPSFEAKGCPRPSAGTSIPAWEIQLYDEKDSANVSFFLFGNSISCDIYSIITYRERSSKNWIILYVGGLGEFWYNGGKFTNPLLEKQHGQSHPQGFR
jgi:hypothetical protein